MPFFRKSLLAQYNRKPSPRAPPRVSKREWPIRAAAGARWPHCNLSQGETAREFFHACPGDELGNGADDA
jgi:hypothetical protein